MASPSDGDLWNARDSLSAREESALTPRGADEAGTTPKPSPELLAFEAFSKSVLQTTRSLGRDLNRHAPTYMGAFGAAIIVAVLIMQVDLAVDFALTSAEFIAVIVAGLIMVCLGAALVAIRLRSFERTEVAYGEQAKEILMGETLVPGSTLHTRMGEAGIDEHETGGNPQSQASRDMRS